MAIGGDHREGVRISARTEHAVEIGSCLVGARAEDRVIDHGPQRRYWERKRRQVSTWCGELRKFSRVQARQPKATFVAAQREVSCDTVSRTAGQFHLTGWQGPNDIIQASRLNCTRACAGYCRRTPTAQPHLQVGRAKLQVSRYVRCDTLMGKDRQRTASFRETLEQGQDGDECIAVDPTTQDFGCRGGLRKWCWWCHNKQGG